MTGPEIDEIRDLRQAVIEVIRQLTARVEMVAVRQERESTARRQADDLTRSVLQRAVVERLGEVRSELATLSEGLRAHRHVGAAEQQAEVTAVVQQLERTREDLQRLAESQSSIVEHQSAVGTRLDELAAAPPAGDWSLVERIVQAVNAQAEQIAALVASLDDARSAIVAVGESQNAQAGDQVALDQRVAELVANQPALIQHANDLAANTEALDQRLTELAANQAVLDQRLANQPAAAADPSALATLDQRLAELAVNLPALVQHANELGANQAAMQQQLAALAAGHAALHQLVAELAERFAAPPPVVGPGHQAVPTATPLAVLEAELRDIEHRLAQRTGRPDANI